MKILTGRGEYGLKVFVVAGWDSIELAPEEVAALRVQLDRLSGLSDEELEKAIQSPDCFFETSDEEREEMIQKMEARKASGALT